MIKYIYNLFQLSGQKSHLFQFLIILCVLLIILLINNRFKKHRGEEAFTQNEKYVLKTNNDIYDDFYCQIHDTIHLPEQRMDFELIQLLEMTQPSTNHSVILDIGSGTGHLVNELVKAGYNTYGVDKSKAMIEYADKKYPKCYYSHGDVMEPMLFEKSTFTHILCTYFTIYELENKRTFFRNCYYWLMSNGYLIIHLVEPTKFDTIVPIAKAKLDVNPQQINKNRITDSIVNFNEFEYRSSYKMGKSNNEVVFKETFKDKNTGKIRHNDMIMTMDNLNGILQLAADCGFVVHSYVNMKNCIDDEHQYIYVFEKMQGKA